MRGLPATGKSGNLTEPAKGQTSGLDVFAADEFALDRATGGARSSGASLFRKVPILPFPPNGNVAK